MAKTFFLVGLVALGCGGGTSESPRAVTASTPTEVTVPSPPDDTREPLVMVARPVDQPQWDLAPAEPPIAIDPREPDGPTSWTYVAPDTSTRLLPESFRVYVRGNTVINHPQPGFQERVLPTVNDFRGAPGCYVACYSRNSQGSAYGVGGGIHVVGQVRVPGRYEGRVCLPDRYGRADISAQPGIQELCKASIPACGDQCWGGGDTGGWFGVQ